MSLLFSKEHQTLREELVAKRIRLISIKDEHTNLVKGSEGEVFAVDDIGQIHVQWDNGSTLALIPGIDTYTKI